MTDDNTPQYASIRFLDDKNKNYFRSIKLIKNLKVSEHHIKPFHNKDYEEEKCYFIYWCECEKAGECYGDKMCPDPDIKNNNKYFKGYVTSLGETVNECRKKITQRIGRIKFRRKFSSSESDEEPLNSKSKDHDNERKKSKSVKIKVRQDNSNETLELYKKKLLNERKKITNSEASYSSISDDDNNSDCHSCQKLKSLNYKLKKIIEENNHELFQWENNLRHATGETSLQKNKLNSNVKRSLFNSQKENEDNMNVELQQDEPVNQNNESNINTIERDPNNDENYSNLKKYKYKLFKQLKSSGLLQQASFLLWWLILPNKSS